MLAATDPANPYGAALPWPKQPNGDDARPAARLARAARTHVVLVDGSLAATLSPRGRQVAPLLPDDAAARDRVGTAAAQALVRWCERTSCGALGWAVGEGPALAESALAPYLAAVGFVRSGPGYRLASSLQAAPDDDADE